MKILEGLIAVQWHGYAYQEVWFNGSGCLIGASGRGKSVLIDGLQAVLIADLRRLRFNPSAHDHVDRDLLGYLRWKIGQDGRTYLSRGDATSYFILQFLDTVSGEHFLLGLVADSFADNITYRHKYFCLEDTVYRRDLIFSDEERLRNISAWRTYLAATGRGRLFDTIDEYQKFLLAKMGGLEERFFTVFPKAIAFQPILEVRKFIHQYILDPQPLNLQTMRENLVHWTRLKEKAATVKEQLGMLEQILETGRRWAEAERLAGAYDLACLKVVEEEAAAKVARLEETAADNEARMAEAQEAVTALKREAVNCEEHRDHLKARLLGLSSFQEHERLKREREEAEKRLASLERQYRQLLAAAELGRQKMRALLGTGSRRRLTFKGMEETILWSFADRLEEMTVSGADVPDVELLGQVGQILDRLEERLGAAVRPLLAEREELAQKVRLLEKDLKELERGQRVYPKNVNELRRLIREAVGEDPKPLCELIEVPSSRWCQAVEGFLNTRRFDLILPPILFDKALAVYEREKIRHHIYGIGLVNTAKTAAEGEAFPARLPGSLAEEVVTDNPYARGYVDQLLGRLIKCDTEQDLKKHERAITATCMTYLNNAARQIRADVYETPYIGREALRRQKEAKEEELATLKGRLEEVRREAAELAELNKLLKDRQVLLTKLAENRHLLTERADLEAKLKRVTEELTMLDQKEWQDLHRELAAVEEQYKAVASTLKEKERLIAQLEVIIATNQSDLAKAREELAKATAAWEERGREAERRWGKAIWQEAVDHYLRFIDRLPPGEEPNYPEIGEKLAARRTSLVGSARRYREPLILMMNEYSKTYHFGGGSDPAAIGEYRAEYQRLLESELPRYTQQIQEAKAQAEQEFKEHVLYRLKEHIESARQTFANLNQVCRDITFGSERYRFDVKPNPEYKRFYDAIMDEENFEGYSLFTTAYQEKHREVLDELFSRLEDSMPLDVAAGVDDITDYRHYLTYDIKIIYNDGHEASLDKICRGQSGGETQTPFYMAMAASFLHLYQTGVNPNTLRLVVLDEAFNKMDAERTTAVIRFLKRLGLQVLIAAPESKLEEISPAVETTVLCFKDDQYRLWAQLFHKKAEDDGLLSPPGHVFEGDGLDKDKVNVTAAGEAENWALPFSG